jgi:2-keto-4-pentenoate hydratase
MPSLPSSLLRDIARTLIEAQDGGHQIDPITNAFPAFSNADAYQVSEFVRAQRLADGARVCGRKIGFTNPGMWTPYGVDEPIWGSLYAHTTLKTDLGHIGFTLDGLCEPRIEPEIVVHFSRQPTAGDSLHQLVRCIDWVALGFEVVQSHYPGWQFKASDTIADNGLHAALLVAEPMVVEAVTQHACERLCAALEQFEITVWRNGEAFANGRGSNVLGSPLLAVAHLLEVLAEQPDSEPVRAGDLVTTGTLTEAHAVEAGETWHSTLNGIALPPLQVMFSAGTNA